MKRIFIYIYYYFVHSHVLLMIMFFFGKGNKHQISFAAGESIRRGGVEHLYTAFLTYSEPSDFFLFTGKK